MKTRQDYNSKRCTHREYYSQFVTEGTKQYLIRRFGSDYLKQKLIEDKNLNSIELRHWDSMPLFLDKDMRDYGDYLTMAGHVCILKEAARQVIEENTDLKNIGFNLTSILENNLLKKSMKAEYRGSRPYGQFITGKEVVSGTWGKVGYWMGCNQIRVGRDYYYICIAGSHIVPGGALGFCEHIFRVSKSQDVNYAIKNISDLQWFEELIFGKECDLFTQEDYYGYDL